ncbi:MAG TPA: hypothetical protein PLO78_00615 [Candidatus Omnitrophota bacterium]|nr:hypothetical protein [Candidatus Omnitrophota bacterium]
MRKRTLFSIAVLAMTVLHLGVIRRNEDPIRDTQTDPILYEQKMEQEKDGVKGALLYHVKYNPKEKFFIDPPYVPKGKVVEAENAVVTKPADISNWWEEEPVSENTPPIKSESEDQTGLEASQEKENLEAKASDQVVPNSESSQSDPKEDYWW